MYPPSVLYRQFIYLHTYLLKLIWPCNRMELSDLFGYCPKWPSVDWLRDLWFVIYSSEDFSILRRRMLGNPSCLLKGFRFVSTKLKSSCVYHLPVLRSPDSLIVLEGTHWEWLSSSKLSVRETRVPGGQECRRRWTETGVWVGVGSEDPVSRRRFPRNSSILNHQSKDSQFW